MTLPVWGWAIASIIVGGGIVWWILQRINQAEADRIAKLSLENYVKGLNQATEAEKAEKDAAEKVKNDPNDKPVTSC